MFELNKEFKSANIPRTIRFTEKIYNELSDISKKNDVSLNYLVLQCCRYALDNMIIDNKNEEKEK